MSATEDINNESCDTTKTEPIGTTDEETKLKNFTNKEFMSWMKPSNALERIKIPNAEEDAAIKNAYDKREVIAEWHVPMKGIINKIEFEHGTASGKRVIWLNEKEILRRDWMFKLVGEDVLMLDNVRCIIRVDPLPGFKYNYSLFVDGKPFEKFNEHQSKSNIVWEVPINNKLYRIVLEKNSLNIWLNGKIRDEVGEFVDGGTDTEFIEDTIKFLLSARTSGSKQDGLVYKLHVNGAEITEVKYS